MKGEFADMLGLQEQISARFADLSPQEQLAATYVVDHPTAPALMSLRKLSSAAGVSQYSVIRFFRKFGIESYETLRRLAREGIVTDPLSAIEKTRDAIATGAEGKSGRAGSMLGAQLNQVLNAIRAPDAAELDRLAAIFMRAKVNYIIGFKTSQALAQHFHYCGQHAHKNLLLVSGTSGYSIDQIAGIGSDDVAFALSFKPYARMTVRLCQYAKSRGARVVAMTDSKLSPLYTLADDVIFVPAEGPSYFNSIVGPTIVLERLLARMVTLDDPSASKRLKTYRTFSRFLDRPGH